MSNNSDEDWDAWEKARLDSRSSPAEQKKDSSSDSAYYHTYDPETGNIFTEDVGGMEKAIGTALRGVAKVPGELSDLPFTGHNLKMAIAKGKAPGTSFYERMGDLSGGDPESGMIFDEKNYLPQGHLSTGVTEGTEKLFDSLTNNRFVPKDKTDKFYENVGGFLGSSYLPAAASKVLGWGSKLASKATPSVAKESLKKLGSKFTESHPNKSEFLDTTGNAGKKIYDFLTQKPKNSEAVIGVGTEWAADTLENGLDLNDPKQAALAALLRPILSIGAPQAGNLGRNVLEKKVLSNAIDPKKYNLLTNLGLSPSIPDIVKDNTTTGAVIKTLASRSMTDPLGSRFLHTNLESNVDKLAKHLKVGGRKKVNVNETSKVLKRGGKKYFDEINNKADAFDKQFYPQGKAPPLSEVIGTPKTFDSLSPQEQGQLFNKYLKDRYAKGLSIPEGNELSKELNAFSNESFSPVKELKKVEIFDPSTKETISIDVLKSPNEHYVSLPKTVEAFYQILNNKRLPAHLRDRIEALKKSKGLMEFGQLDNLRKDFNNANIPVGNSKFTSKEISFLKNSIRADEVNHFRQFDLNEKAFHDKQRFFRDDVYKNTPKDTAQEPWKEAVRTKEPKELFNTALDDISKNNRMANIYINKLNPKESRVVASNFLREKGWNNKTDDIDFTKIKDYYRDLDTDGRRTYQKLIAKASGNPNIHVDQVFDAMDLLESTYKNISSKDSRTLNRLLYNQIPAQTQSFFKELIGGSLFSAGAKGATEIVKSAIPYMILRGSNKLLTDPTFINYIIKGKEIKNVGHWLSWLRNGYDHKFLSKQDLTLLQNAISKKNEQLDDNKNKRKTRSN